MLASEGYEILRAATGAEALRLARAESPDLVLLSVTLPDADGVAVCQEIKGEADLNGMFVVMLSGLGTTTARRASRKEPARPLHRATCRMMERRRTSPRPSRST